MSQKFDDLEFGRCISRKIQEMELKMPYAIKNTRSQMQSKGTNQDTKNPETNKQKIQNRQTKKKKKYSALITP